MCVVCVRASTNPTHYKTNEFYSYSKVIEKLFMLSHLKWNENYADRIQPHYSTFLSFSKTNSNFHMIFSFNNRQYAYDVFYCCIFFGSSKYNFIFAVGLHFVMNNRSYNCIVTGSRIVYFRGR